VCNILEQKGKTGPIILVAITAHHIPTPCKGIWWINTEFSVIVRACISSKMKPSFVAENE
jgi:hypothetical protein